MKDENEKDTVLGFDYSKLDLYAPYSFLDDGRVEWRYGDKSVVFDPRRILSITEVSMLNTGSFTFTVEAGTEDGKVHTITFSHRDEGLVELNHMEFTMLRLDPKPQFHNIPKGPIVPPKPLTFWGKLKSMFKRK